MQPRLSSPCCWHRVLTWKTQELQVCGGSSRTVCAGAAQELPSLGAMRVYLEKQIFWAAVWGKWPQSLPLGVN